MHMQFLSGCFIDIKKYYQKYLPYNREVSEFGAGGGIRPTDFRVRRYDHLHVH